MGVAALIVWILTASFGLYLLAIWLIEYDREQHTAAATRLPIPVLGGHALLALAGLAVWGAYLIFDNERLAWAAVAILGCVAVLGLTMAVRWLGIYRTTGASSAPAGTPATIPPERNFPVTVVVAHGLVAVTTLVLVLLTALGVGGS